MQLNLNQKNMERLKTSLLLASIFLVGFSTVYLSHGPRLSDPDAWHYYNLVNDIVDTGKVRELDLRAYYPSGADWRVRDNLFHSYFIAYTFKMFQPLGIPLMRYLMLFPAIFGGGLGAVCLYLAIKELLDKKAALFSALLYAFMPPMLSRVYSGTIDKETVYGITVFPLLYFFVKSLKTEISFNQPMSLVFPILAGIFYGLAYGSWSGGSYIVLVISTTTAIHFAFHRDINKIKPLFIVAILGPVVMHLLQPIRYPFNYFFPNFNSSLPLIVSTFPLMSITISNFLKTRNKDVHFTKVMAGVIVAIGLLFFAGGKGGMIKDFMRAPVLMIMAEEGAQKDLYMATVAESQPSSFFGGGSTMLQRIMNGDYFRELGLALFVIPLGILLLLLNFRNRKDFSTLFVLVWALSGLVAANQGLRYLFFLAPSAAVVAGYAFARLYDEVKRRELEIRDILNSTSKKRVLQRAESRRTNVGIAHLALIVSLFMVTMSTLNTAVAGRNFQSDLPRPWYDATMWFKDNTPEDSVIFFWWDYGYYFQALSNKRTIADGGGNVMRNINLANMFSSPEDEAIKYIKKYVDYEKTPTYMLVSYEEFGKSGAINRIAGGDPEIGGTRFEEDGRVKDGQIYILNFQIPRIGDSKQDEQNLANALSGNNPYRMPFSTFYIVNMGDSYLVWALVQFDQKGNFHPEWAEKLLPKLLPFNTGYGQGLEHFELVYQDQWNYILIYKVK